MATVSIPGFGAALNSALTQQQAKAAAAPAPALNRNQQVAQMVQQGKPVDILKLPASTSAPSTSTTTMPPAGVSYPATATAAGTAPAASAGYQSQYKGPDMAGMQDQLNKQYDAAYQAQLTALKNQLATQLQGYNSQETQANQAAYDNRNSNDVMSLQQMKAVKEQMAAQGTAGGGDSVTAQIANDAARQSGANSINRDQANALQDISQKRSLAQNQSASNELALKQQLDSQKSGQLLDLLKYGDTMNYNADNSAYGRYQDKIQNDAQYGGTYNGQQTQQAKQQQIQNDAMYGGTYNGGMSYQAQQDKIANDAQYAGTYGGNKTVAQQQQEWLRQQQQIQNDAQYAGQYNGKQTQAAQQQAYDQSRNTKNDNWNAYMDMVNQTGNLGKGPTANWGALPGQANSGGLTMNGQTNLLNNTNVMAQLTGKMPDGTKTTAEQQRTLENLWKQADMLGTVPDQLATMLGIPKGTQTQQALQFSLNYGLNQDQNDLAWVNAANKQQGSGDQAKYNGFSANQVLDAVKNSLYDSYGSPKDGSPSVDPQKIYDTVASYGLPMGQDDQVMLALGLTKDQIAAFDKANGVGK